MKPSSHIDGALVLEWAWSDMDAETGEVRAVYVHPDHLRQHVFLDENAPRGPR